MPRGDPYPQVKRQIIAGLRTGLEQYGFSQFRTTTYWYRDRGPLRDAVFFQKMRSTAICVAYGISRVPTDSEWSPGLKPQKWLEDQEFYSCRYLDHAERSVKRIVSAFEREALIWFEQFKSLEDLEKVA